MSGPQIVFAGTPDFAVPSLHAILDTGIQISAVLTQPDRPAGRGRKLAASPVKAAARAAGLKVEQPASLAAETFGTVLRALAPDLLIVVAYGLILPTWVLELPQRGAVNVHASLLPRWRGAAPIQRAILAGDRETGVSLMQMDAGLDTGPVYRRERVPITAQTTGGELHDTLAELGARVLVDCLAPILDGSLSPTPQPSEGATYAHKISKEEARIDWRLPAESIGRLIRAFNPWPVAESSLSDGRRIRVWQAAAVSVDTGNADAGTVLEAGPEGILVAAGQGAVRLEKVQAPSAKVVDAAAYVAAKPVDGLKFVG